MLLAQDLLLALTLLLGAQVAVLFLQEPHGGPTLLLKVTLVFYKETMTKIMYNQLKKS